MPVPPPPLAKKVFSGVAMDFWQWEQPLYDGSSATYDCVTRPDTTSVLVFLDADTVLLTRQEQPQKDKPFFDFPGGRVDPGEDSQTGALRELQEETGYRAGRVMEWHRIAQRGMTRFEEIFYVATDMTGGFPTHKEPGERIELVPTPWKKLVEMCLHRQLRQPITMLAILQMEFDPESRKRLRDWLG
jgi:ADP-ribose pyrophosphatase